MKNNTKKSSRKIRVLIIGAKGMLGQELVSLFKDDKAYQVTAWDIKEIDITRAREVSAKIGKLKPAVILNAAAYNAVDEAEKKSGFEKAKALNGKAPGHLAKVAKKISAVLVHYSTDYVFDGLPDVDQCGKPCGGCNCSESATQRNVPQIGFKEDAKPDPISNYGKSKLLGEQAVAKVGGKYYIIRLSKLFGRPAKAKGAKRSFFNVMLKKGKNPPASGVKVVNEEISCFTYAPDLARKTKEILESKKPPGIYHVTNSGSCTWYEAVLELFKQAKIKTKAVPVSSDEFPPRPAERPLISTLINTKLNPLRSWKAALKEYLKTLKT